MPRRRADDPAHIRKSPWLGEPAKLEEDIHLRRLRKHRYIYRWDRFLDYSFEDGVYIVTGPRQVGKTTHLKMLTRQQPSHTVNSNCLSFNCDLLDTRKEIVAVVETFLNRVADRNARAFVVLDEITSVKDSFLAIKYCIDAGLDENITYLLT